MIGRRPDRAAAHVAQVDELAVRRRAWRRAATCVTGRPRQTLLPPPALVTDVDVVAVRQELRVRKRACAASGSGAPASTAAARRRASRRAAAARSVATCARHALLQQQLGRLDARIGVKALDHAVAEQRVGQRDERHALRGGPDTSARRRPPPVRARSSPVASGLACGVVDGVEEPVVAGETRGGEPPQVGRARGGIDHDGQRGGVRRDDQLVAEPALQAEARECRTPCTDRCRADRRGCRPTRRCPRARRARRRSRSAGGPPAGTTRRAACPDSVRMTQQRHQVLEQRRAPREQHRRAADARDRPSEMEPVHLGHVALGDGEEAGQPRFGRQQIVVRRIEPAGALGVGEAVADREQLPLRIEQEPEVHRVEQRRRARAASARRDARASADRQREERAGEVAAVHGRDVGRRQRRQRPRVVPVEQVPLEPFEPLRPSSASRRSGATSSVVSMKPRSCAASVASRPRPMLVGDVRCATRQLRRRAGRCRAAGSDPRRRRTCRSTPTSCRAIVVQVRRVGGRQHRRGASAPAGSARRRSTARRPRARGSARPTGSAAGRPATTTSSERRRASSGLAIIPRDERAAAAPAPPRAALAAVVSHSSRRRRVTPRRTSVIADRVQPLVRPRWP